MARTLWAGLDVGVETTSICVIDGSGEVLQETVCRSCLMSVHHELRWLRRRRSAKLGLEAANGWNLARGLRSLGYSVDVYETRQLSKFLRVRRNKTDAGDAIGIAEAGRVGASVVGKVHLKSLECQMLQSRLMIRRRLILERIKAQNLLIRQIQLFGGQLRRPTKSKLREEADRELKQLFGKTDPPFVRDLRYLIGHCEQLLRHQHEVDRELASAASANEICARFMQIPGVGPLCALSFYATVGEPGRFARSGDVGSYLGLAPTLHQSGVSLRAGRISKMGNKAARSLLVQAAVTFMRAADPDTPLRKWASAIEQRRGRGRSRVALARKLATIMLAMWKTGESFQANRCPVGMAGG